jgi:hypothetical protein
MALLTSLPLSLLLLGGGHPSLHPAGANLYLEVPSPQQAIEAYPQAGLMQLLHDRSVVKLIAQLMGEDPEGFDMDALLAESFDEAMQGAPELQLIRSALGDARSLSLSLSNLNLDELGGRLARSDFALTPEVLEQLGSAQLRVVIGHEGASAEELTAAFEGLSSFLRLPLGEEELQQGQAPGHELELSVWRSEVLFGRELFLAQEDGRLLLGLGTDAAGSFLTETSALSGDADFLSCGSSFAEPEGVVLYDLYVNATEASELSELVANLDPELTTIGEALGVATSIAVPGDHFQERWRTSLSGGRFIAETASIDHGRDAGQQPLLGVTPVKVEALSLVPSGAAAVWATTVNKQGVAELLLRTLTQSAGADPEAVLAELEDSYGLDPRRDLIEPMGESLVFYVMPFSGIGAPKMFLALELEDPEAFAAGMERFGEAAVLLSGGALEFKSKPYRKNPFMSFSPAPEQLGGAGAGGDIADTLMSSGIAGTVLSSLASGLAVGIVEGRAVVSLSNIYTKREMKRLLAGEGDSYSLGGEGSGLPEGVTSYGVNDWGALIDSLYSSLKGMFPLLQQGVGGSLPFSMEDLPADGLFSRYMKPTVSWSRKTERGFYSHSDASFGPELLALTSGGAASVFFSSSEPSEFSDEPVVVAELEIGSDASADDEQAETTRVILSGVKVGIVVYKADRGAYPATLGELVTPTADFPDGYIGGKEVPTDAWGHVLNYTLAEDGASFRLWSTGPNGVNEDGGGDDQSLPARRAL